MRARLAELVSSVSEGGVDGETAELLESVLELGLQTGRVRAYYGPGGEQAALATLRRLPRGRARAESTKEVSAALRALNGAQLDAVRIAAVAPGAFTLSIEAGGFEASVRLDSQRRAADEPRDMSDIRYYMACLDLRGRDCLVVGGGRVATEKVHGLLDCEAKVTVVAPHVDDELRRLPVRVELRPFSRSDVVGRFLVIAATSDRSVNADVSSVARERETLCNVADDPELCSYILPAVVRRDPIVVGVSTGGASPALAQRIRADVAELVRPEHADLARRLEALRAWAKAELPTYEERRDYFQQLVSEAY